MIKKLLGSLGLALSIMAVAVVPTMAYEVKEGDTLGGIAEAHGISLWEISTLNPQIENLDKIFVGEQIRTAHEAYLSNTDEVFSEDATDTKLQGYEERLLAQLVYAEARGESYKGKVAVAEVVLNRLESPKFPNTLKEVIYQPKQFVPAYSGSIYNVPDTDSVRAVQEAMRGTNYTQGALYFYNAQTATNRWLDTLPTITVIGSHTFK